MNIKLMNMNFSTLRRRMGLYLIANLVFFNIAEAQSIFNTATLWKENENGYFTHFVYGLSVTKKGSVLAFAEARIKDGSDHGAHHIVMKRSTDKGKSFSESKILVESMNGESWANPTALVEKKSGKIFLFYALNMDNEKSRVFYKESKNDGKSWSDPTEITSMFSSNKRGWTFHLPGPGHGIQLRDGRLIVPVWHRKSISFPSEQRAYGVNFIYSDNRGKSWNLGGETPVGELNESQMVQKENGDLLFIGRTINGSKGSYQAKLVSKDGGISWPGILEYDEQLVGRACDIGLVRYCLKPNIILVSQPASLSKREKLTIRMSEDDGNTWRVSKVLDPGLTTYSDLAVLPDKTVICLYGTGSGPTKAVSIARFNLNWLVEKF
jgi:sialidase-1